MNGRRPGYTLQSPHRTTRLSTRKSDPFANCPQNVGLTARRFPLVRYSFTHALQTSPSTSAAPSPSYGRKKARSHSALWHSESGIAPPKRVVIGDDQMTADSAYRLACEGTAILWRGDFQNARQLLQAVARRIETRPKKSAKAKAKERSRRPRYTAAERRLPPMSSTCIGSPNRSGHARSACCSCRSTPIRHSAAPCAGCQDACEEAYGARTGSRSCRCVKCSG